LEKETEQAWYYMFLGLKELVKTGKLDIPEWKKWSQEEPLWPKFRFEMEKVVTRTAFVTKI
jgi:hypothetical protein